MYKDMSFVPVNTHKQAQTNISDITFVAKLSHSDTSPASSSGVEPNNPEALEVLPYLM